MSGKFTLRSRVEAAKAQNGFTYTNFVHRDDFIPLVQIKEAIKEYMEKYGVSVDPNLVSAVVDQRLQSLGVVTQNDLSNLTASYWQSSLYHEQGTSRIELKTNPKVVPGGAFHTGPESKNALFRFWVGIEVKDFWQGTLKIKLIAQNGESKDCLLPNVTIKDASEVLRMEIQLRELRQDLGYEEDEDFVVTIKMSAENVTGNTKVHLETVVLEKIPL